MAGWNPARLAGPFTVDPRIAIFNHIKNNWNDLMGIGLTKSNINFDKLWFDGTKERHIIIEKLPTTITPQTLGGSRARYEDHYRIQVGVYNHSAINDKFLMEQEIQRIILGDPQGIQNVVISGENTATGIDYAWIDSFDEIPVYNDALLNDKLMPSKPKTVARSRALCKLYYDKVRA